MLKIRLQRHGARHNPIYRIVVTESSHRRDGRHKEMLGHYAPKAKGNDPEYRLNIERAEYWLSVGAQPSDTVRSLMRRARRDMKAMEVYMAEQAAAAPAPAPAEPAEA